MIELHELPKRRPPHPGALIADVLEDYGLTQQQLADRLAMPRHRLNEIIHGRRGITPDSALRLSRVLGTSAPISEILLSRTIFWQERTRRRPTRMP
jgi:addiction module HigA family antidote